MKAKTISSDIKEDDFVDMYFSSVVSGRSENNFSILIKQVSELAQNNRETLQSIEDRMHDCVVTGYKYDLIMRDSKHDVYTAHTINKKEPLPYSIRTHTEKHKIVDLIQSWRYKGQPLEEENIFGSTLCGITMDFSLIVYDDVKRLVKFTDEMVHIYRFFCDNNITRLGLQTVLINLELIQAALLELRELTINVNDEVEQLELLLTKLCGYHVTIQSSSMCVEAIHMKKRNFDLLKTQFRALSSLHSTQIINCHQHIVTTLDSCYYQGKHCIVSSSRDGCIKIWNTSHYTLEKTLVNCDDTQIDSLCVYNFRGVQSIAVGLKDEIKVWNLSDSSEISIPCGHRYKTYVLKATYQPDDDKMILISGGGGGIINLWDLNTYNLINVIQTNMTYVYDITIIDHEISKYIAVAGNSGDLNIYSLFDHTSVSKLSGHKGSILALSSCMHKGKTLLASGGSDYDIRLWDMCDYSCIGIQKGHSNKIRALSFIPCQGRIYLVSASDDKSIKVWNVEEREVIKTLNGLEASVWSLLHYCDGNESFLVSGNSIGKVQIWKE